MFRETHLIRLSALDGKLELRLVEKLIHMGVHRAGDLANLIRDLLRDGEIPGHVHADELHVDGRGKAEVQYLADDVRRLEEELHAGIIAR